MSSRQINTSFLLIALILASCLIVAANAEVAVEEAEIFPICNVCVYNHNINVPNDPSEGVCFMIELPGVEVTADLRAPFEGENGVTIDVFRSVGLSGCGSCTLAVYSSAVYNGKSAVIDGSVSFSILSFFAKSFYLNCNTETGGEELLFLSR